MLLKPCVLNLREFIFELKNLNLVVRKSSNVLKRLETSGTAFVIPRGFG